MKPQEKALWDKYNENSGVGQRNDLIEFYIPLVKRVVGIKTRRIPHRHEIVENLFQEGIIAITGAISSYNSSKNTSPSTYLSKTLDWRLKDFFRGEDNLKRPIRRRVTTLRHTIGTLESRLGRSPSNLEIEAVTGFNPQEINQLRCIGDGVTYSLDYASKNGDYEFLFELPESKEEQPHHQIQKRELVQRVLDRLNSNELTVLDLHLWEGKSFEEISRILGSSGRKISKIYHGILEQARERIKVA